MIIDTSTKNWSWIGSLRSFVDFHWSRSSAYTSNQRHNSLENFWRNYLNLGWVITPSALTLEYVCLSVCEADSHTQSCAVWQLKVSYLKTYNLLLFVHTLMSLCRTACFLVIMETLLFCTREQLLQTLHHKTHGIDICCDVAIFIQLFYDFELVLT